MRVARRRDERREELRTEEARLQAEDARLQAEGARLESERRNLGRTRTRAESWALIVAALAGAAGLSVTAWGTYWAAQVAEDQLAQSKEQDEDKQKDQASKVTFWKERMKAGDGDTLVIANRSLDPVSYVRVHVTVRYWKGEDLTASVVAAGSSSALPPCSALRVTSAGLMRSFGKRAVGSAAVDVNAFEFYDSKGKVWQRTDDGVLRAGEGWPVSASPPLVAAPAIPLKGECASGQ
ncbi:hypothetical protein [Streptomyces chilikensis]|uniref:Lipoprotein n=1 Tax=Streptomyces chilikensis TaxID=1194079 RepID=A0ABV3EJC8_9ACTN